MTKCIDIASRSLPDIASLLRKTVELEGSDLHITLDSPPMLRVDGELVTLPWPRLAAADIEELLAQVLTARQIELLRQKCSVDLAYALDTEARFRVNAFFQRGAMAAVFRRLPSLDLTIEALGLPQSIHDFSGLKDGLVLVTGPTGSGKTTTLATIIDLINRKSACHIITIEDPIEIVHCHKQSVVTQRELNTDVPSLADGLRDALREDPDVILVGEMRDLETMRTAIMAAETGHLVFSTLHSRDSISSLNRMISSFPVAEQAQIRLQLSSVLRGVVSQRLLRSASGRGRWAAVEVMKVNSAIANLIRVGKPEQIYSLIEMGTKEGMQTMESALAELFRRGCIDRETALGMAKSEALIAHRLGAGRD